MSEDKGKKHSIEVDEEVFEALQELATPLVDTPNSVLRRLLLEGPSARWTRISTVESPYSGLGGPGRLAERPQPERTQAEMPPPTAPLSSEAPGAEDEGPYASLGHERRAESGMSPRRFGKLLCAREFPGEMFERARRERGAFRTMFESEERLLYFLNFNKPGATNLWYKVNSTALQALLDAEKPAHVVFANPADRLAWVIPIEELEAQYRRAGSPPFGSRDIDLNVDVKGDRLRELDWGIGEYRREV